MPVSLKRIIRGPSGLKEGVYRFGGDAEAAEIPQKNAAVGPLPDLGSYDAELVLACYQLELSQ